MTTLQNAMKHCRQPPFASGMYIPENSPREATANGPSAAVNSFYNLWGRAHHPGDKSAPRNAAPAGRGRVTGCHRVWTLVFTNSVEIWFLHQCWACEHLAKHPENTMASHPLPQVCRSPRTLQERLQLKLWLSAHHQGFPSPPRVICYCKRLPQLVR